MSKHSQILQNRFSHPRDNFIRFYTRGHKYEITSDPDTKYTSVTTWNHKHFPKFDADAVIQNIFKGKNWGPDHKYWGQTAEQIKISWKSNGDAVSGAGTNLHDRIECFMNNDRFDFEYTQKDLYETYINDFRDKIDEQIEWEYFLHFVRDHPNLKPYRTEWMIYDEDLKLAGSIDMVYENLDGTLSIYDWKRSKDITKHTTWNKFALNPLIKHLPDTNFWHYALQLNTYKSILERKYGKQVTNLYLVRLHPDIEEKTYELLEVPILTTEMCALFEEREDEIKTI
jgi:ATP-dependent exoDNAse (exonuclease V) beta subunit